MIFPDIQRERGGFDCAVMLTWSDWHTEMRGNRYHFATRFARLCPLYFVQPDLRAGTLRSERVPGHSNLTILHIPMLERNIVCAPLRHFLHEAGHRRPLLWCYNFQCAPFYCTMPQALRVYHASEDYHRILGPNLPALKEVVAASDLIVCVSDGVRESLDQHIGSLSQSCVVTNGCDYGFFARPVAPPALLDGMPRPRVLYQGAISAKVDFCLLLEVIAALPDVHFIFAGAVSLDFRGGEALERQWKQITRRSNVRYLGRLAPEELPGLLQACDVGLMPFVKDEWIVKSAFPLKTFEYLAAGLAVVSTPMDNLRPYASLLTPASTPEEFADGIRLALKHDDAAARERRRAAAREQDYGLKFKQVLALLARHDPGPVPGEGVGRSGPYLYNLVAADSSCMPVALARTGLTEKYRDITTIGLELRPEAERTRPILEVQGASTLMRRPLVPFPWHTYLMYAREVLVGWSKGEGMFLGMLIVTLAGVRAGMDLYYWVVWHIIVPAGRAIRRGFLPRLRASAREPAQPSGTGPGRPFRKGLGVETTIQRAYTLVYAVDEIMVRPDCVRSFDPIALLAGAVCKRKFGCPLIYNARGAGFGMEPEAAAPQGWLLTSLERCLIGRADTVIASDMSDIDIRATTRQPLH
jgi:glycosyltransferase involved in cell wall biosynthesis